MSVLIIGGGFAVLIATADLLTNSASLFGDVGKQTGRNTSSTAGAASKPLTATQAGAVNLNIAKTQQLVHHG